MGGAEEKAHEKPLILPDDVKGFLKEYRDNAARSFFPKPESICYEDIDRASMKYGILFLYYSGEDMWFVFPDSYGLTKGGQNRSLTINRKHPEGVES
jgi:hypothetical protein